MTSRISPSAVPITRRVPSWVEVDLAAVRHNVRALRALIAPSTVLAVVKANAYGHGAIAVARAAQEAGAMGWAVACLHEGVQLRQAGLTGPMLLLNAGQEAEAREIVELGLTQTLCREELAGALAIAASAAGRPAFVHLKLDTGMGRLGVLPEHVAALAEVIEKTPGIEVKGVFSHLATAEDPDPDYARLQLERFRTGLTILTAHRITPGIRHLANSAATLRYPEMRFDAVRTGLLIYGIDPYPQQTILPLHPVLSWKTRIAFVRRLPAGSAISYARTYVTTEERLVGVLPLGYADGFPRSASNRAQVLVRGQFCPVIGTVCMDHVVVDLTPAAHTAPPAGDIRVGEEVVLIGEQMGAHLTANQLADWAGTVVHEIPTRLGPRVSRIYLHETVSGDGESAKRGKVP